MRTGVFTRSSLRVHSKTAWAYLLRGAGLLYLARQWVQRRGPIVLTFHRILSESELQQTASLPGMIVRDGTFDSFLQHASEFCEFVDLAREPVWGPSAKLRLAVTFDDGWFDNATAAHPAAQKHKTPIVIFIVPERMDTELPFWPERAASALDYGLAAGVPSGSRGYIEQTIEKLKGLPAQERADRIDQMTSAQTMWRSPAPVDTTMNWEQIASLYAAGVIFGSHTSTHEILTTIPLALAEAEIFNSRALIEQKLQTVCRLFSYPNGDCSEKVRDLVIRAGYEMAFLNQEPGVWTRECDPFLIPRVNVCEYHLVNAKGEFSPLIFDYAVVWNAAKGLMGRTLRNDLRKVRAIWQSFTARFGTQAGKKHLEKPS